MASAGWVRIPFRKREWRRQRTPNGRGTTSDRAADAFTVWLTGPPAAGKTTIASLLDDALRGRGLRTQILDGDELRRHLSPDLGFSREDRDLHVRRVTYVAQLLTAHGVAPIVALVSPYRAARDEARRELGRFVEVHVTCPLDTLRARDPKGLYREAASGLARGVTGVDDPYEPPLRAEVTLDTSREAPSASAKRIVDYLEGAGYLGRQ